MKVVNFCLILGGTIEVGGLMASLLGKVRALPIIHLYSQLNISTIASL